MVLSPRRVYWTWVMVVVMLKATVARTRAKENMVVVSFQKRGHSCTMDQACKNRAVSRRRTTGMLRMLAAALLL